MQDDMVHTAIGSAGPAGQARKKFSLGVALLGGLAADGYDSPAARAPTAWLLRLVVRHADAPLRVSVFRTCRGGRDVILAHARKLALTIECLHKPADDEWRRRMAAVRAALRVRGALPTSPQTSADIRAEVWGDDEGAWLKKGRKAHWLRRVKQVATQLAGAGQGVTELDIDLWGEWDLLPFLNRYAAAFPNTTALSINADGEVQAPTLPPPSRWPRLTTLQLYNSTYKFDALWPHIVPYLPQLTTLQLPHISGAWHLPWHLLFSQSPSTPLPLTHFYTGKRLDDALIEQFLTHAPQLTHLWVSEIGGTIGGTTTRGPVVWQLGAHKDRVWGVQELRVSHDHKPTDVLPQLALLPKPRSGRMSVAGYEVMAGRRQKVLVVCISVATTQGLQPAVAERLPLWHLDFNIITVQCTAIPPSEQPMALRRTLHQLAGMHAPDATLWLQGWEWPAVADTLAECLPLLPHLAFGVQWNGPLTDERLAVVMRMGPHMCRLSVDSVALQSDHSGVLWPWSVLCVEKLGVAQLLELPVPSHDAHLRAHKLEMDTCKDLSESEFSRLQGLLRSVQFGDRYWPYDTISATFTGRLKVEMQGANVQKQLGLLQSVRLIQDTDINLEITGAQMDLAFITAPNAGLPVWPARPHFHQHSLWLYNCTWPLRPAAYTVLGYNIPTNYGRWYLGGVTAEVVECVCEGAEARRRDQGVNSLEVRTCAFAQDFTGRQYGYGVNLLRY